MSPNPLNAEPVIAALVGTQEIVIIVVFAFLLFGAKKIPELMRSLGRAQGEFQHAKQQFESEVRATESAKATAASRSPTTSTTYTPASDLAAAQAKAKGLGIDVEGKSLEALNEEIAAKTGGPTA